MKLKLYISMILAGVLFSCSKEEVTQDPMADFNLLEEVSFTNYTMEVYSPKSRWELGYNKILFRVKDSSGKIIDNPSISWTPMMHMMSKTHSCPVSDVKSSLYPSIKGGFVIFQMPSNESEYWDISFDLTINGQTEQATQEIFVNQTLDEMKNVTVFMDDSENKYILALVEPANPKIALNTVEMKFYVMESMTSFLVVNDGKIGLDPRMPSMDNHSSPNNEDLFYNSATGSYEGKLSLTMSGYWKLNLMAYDAGGTLIKGSAVTDVNPSSNLYLELEF